MNRIITEVSYRIGNQIIQHRAFSRVNIPSFISITAVTGFHNPTICNSSQFPAINDVPEPIVIVEQWEHHFVGQIDAY